MEKKEQMLIIDPPSELKFHGPFNKPVITIMKLMNPTEQTILFKIKTTAPKKYCVRPNFGAVEPKASTEVEICLQGSHSFDPNEKSKHKFMVQSFVVPEGATDHAKLWKEIQPEELMDSKLRCVFIMQVEAKAGDFNDTIPVNEMITKEVKTITEEKPKDYQTEYARVTSEVRQLREDESQLRLENIKLKEQFAKYRINAEAQKEQPNSSSTQYQNPYLPPQLEQPVPVMYIIIAIAMAIFGLLLGKYLL